ncbi:MAG: DNA polymerase III subunit gamma/tau [Betaproteobacteria bacterium]|nr:DNA polymerase III subunit gamma/tau [Betaproteobacteria bacterium]
MSHQVLARKWRPRAFADVIGQEHVVRALGNALASGRIHHAYLLTGTRGVGKTTLARILAKALNCETGVTRLPCGQCRACVEIDAGRFVDFLEVDAATNTKVDEMRELLEGAQYAPVAGRYKVYIIDEVHMLSKNAFNAMLKTLEEPPGHVEFVLATTDPQKLPITVLSRCLQFNLKNLPAALIASHLAKVLDSEGVAYELPALDMIGRAAEGSVRDALSLLDQAIAHGAGEVRQGNVAEMLGALDQSALFNLLDAVATRDPGRALGEIDVLAARSVSFDATLKDVCAILSRVALAQHSGVMLEEGADSGRTKALAAILDAESVQLFYQIALLGRRDLSLAPDEQSGFTMTVLRMLAFHPGGTAPRVSDGQKQQRTHDAGPRPAGLATPENEGLTSTSSGERVEVHDWLRFVESLQLSGLAGMLAKQCTFRSFEGGVLDLALPADQKHLLDRTFQDKLRSELSVHLGSKFRLQVAVGQVAGISLAEHEASRRNQEQIAAQSAIAEDPFVRTLREDFGADILPDSIRPITRH